MTQSRMLLCQQAWQLVYDPGGGLKRSARIFLRRLAVGQQFLVGRIPFSIDAIQINGIVHCEIDDSCVRPNCIYQVNNVVGSRRTLTLL